MIDSRAVARGVRPKRAAWLALLGLPLGIVAAHSLLPVTLEELSTRAERIVVAQVDHQEARFNEDGTLILTHTTLVVEETLAGPPTATVEVNEYGGRVGELTLAVPGLPRFEEGERVLLFLCRDALDLVRTCGASQGRLVLSTGAGGTTRANGVLAGKPLDEPLDEIRARIRLAREGRP